MFGSSDVMVLSVPLPAFLVRVYLCNHGKELFYHCTASHTTTVHEHSPVVPIEMCRYTGEITKHIFILKVQPALVDRNFKGPAIIRNSYFQESTAMPYSKPAN